MKSKVINYVRYFMKNKGQNCQKFQKLFLTFIYSAPFLFFVIVLLISFEKRCVNHFGQWDLGADLAIIICLIRIFYEYHL